jgi:signal transduction histidine kinase
MKPSKHITPSLVDRSLWWLQERWPWLRRRLAEPSTELFTRIRLGLIAWYMGILVAILGIAGLLLYFGMQGTVLAPVNDALAIYATQYGSSWRTLGSPPCGSQPVLSISRFDNKGVLPSYVSCYDQNGRFLGTGPISNPMPNDTAQSVIDQFTTANLAQVALAHGSAIDTIDGGATVGAIQRYALTVRDSNGSILGVVQVGYQVQDYENSLHTLNTWLLLTGIVTIVGAGLGGWFIAARALKPARLAVGRQRAFIADAAHELRTPLTLMRANAEALLFHRDQLPTDDVELLDDIVAESGHMTQLAGNLLTLARLDAGVTHMESDVVDLNELFANAVRRVRAFALQERITIAVVSTEPVYVIGDRVLLEQAIIILLDNSIKYNRPDGQVFLQARRREQWVQLEISDTGIGIDPSHLAHIGERFYRVDATHARQTGGAGLGVSIARGIAIAHQGSLIYTSTLHQGTIATLILPGVVAHLPEEPRTIDTSIQTANH